MRVSISIIAVIVVAALTWFGLRPTTTQTTDRIITEVIPSKIVKEEPDDEVEEFLKQVDGKHFLKMDITFGGMACGPTWDATTMVINFAPDIAELEE